MSLTQSAGVWGLSESRTCFRFGSAVADGFLGRYEQLFAQGHQVPELIMEIEFNIRVVAVIERRMTHDIQAV